MTSALGKNKQTVFFRDQSCCQHCSTFTPVTSPSHHAADSSMQATSVVSCKPKHLLKWKRFWQQTSSRCLITAAVGAWSWAPLRQSLMFFTFIISIASQEPSVVMVEQWLKHEQFLMYLNVTMDWTLSYKEQLMKTVAKLKSRNCLLAKLADTTWGASESTLCTSTLALCYSVAEYSAPIWQGPPTPGWLTANWIIPCDWYRVHYSPLNFLELQQKAARDVFSGQGTDVPRVASPQWHLWPFTSAP